MLHPIASIKRSPYNLALVAGVLLVLCQPPVSLSPLAFFALIPLLYALNAGSLRQGFVSGAITGIASNLGLIYWVIVAVHKYGGINIYLSFLILMLFVCYLALYTAFFAFSVSYLTRRLYIPFYLSAPPLWVLFEYARGSLLTGFPWSYLCHSQYNVLPFIQVVSITGAYFISFLIVAMNAILFTILTKKRVSFVYLAVISLLFASSFAYGIMRLRTQDPETLKATIIQGNITQDVKWDEAFKINTVRTYYRGTAEAGVGSDLIVWPETAMPFIFDQEHYMDGYVRSLPALTGAHLLFGTISRDGDGKLRNSVYVLGKDGMEEGRYSKGHLVPFGEYTPLRAYLPFLENMSVQIGEFFPGTSHAPIRTGIGNVGVLVCYEGIFPYITRETVRSGAEVLVNVTNDAWYDYTSAPYQHLAFYVYRAIESDRYVLRAANTGISAIIDTRGHIRGKTRLFKPATVTGGFALKQNMTFYVRHGDYFVLLLFLFLAGIVAARLARPKQP